MSHTQADRPSLPERGALDEILERADEIALRPTHGRPSRLSGYTPKVEVKVRLDADVVDWLKSLGPRHYSRINGLLRAVMELESMRRRRDGIH